MITPSFWIFIAQTLTLVGFLADAANARVYVVCNAIFLTGGCICLAIELAARKICDAIDRKEMADKVGEEKHPDPPPLAAFAIALAVVAVASFIFCIVRHGP